MKKISEYLQIPVAALILIALIYVSLNLADIKNQNKILSQKQIVLETRLLDLEKTVDANKIALEQNQAEIAENQKQIETYKKLALASKMILGAQTEAPVTIEPSSTIQTLEAPAKIVTKTVIVKKEVTKKQVAVVVDGIGSYQVNWQAGDTAWSILKRASTKNNFVLQYQMYDFGVFVTGIGGIVPKGNQYWAFYYNGKYAQVGASDQSVSPGDTTFWQLATF